MTPKEIDAINDRFEEIADNVVDCGNLRILCDMIPLESKQEFIKAWENETSSGDDDDGEVED